MNVTLSLDDNLVKQVRKIAVERDTTLTGLIRSYLEGLATEHNSDRKRRDLERLEQSFERFSTNMNYANRTWRREDLYDRKSR